MAPTFTFESLASDLGTNTADGLRNVANTAANFACSAWRDYAGATAGWDDPTGIGAFNNAVFSRLCGPRPRKQPPNPGNWTGGQCEFNYNVTVAETNYEGVTTNITYFNIPGPIQGMITRVTSPPALRYDIVAPNFTGPPAGFYQVGSVNENDQGQYKRVIVSVARSGGGPDNCGNRDSPFPIVPIPPTVTAPTTNVNVAVGAGAIINVPIVYAPVTFQANASFNPQIQVNVGPFNVTFDSGGVTVSPSFNIGPGGSQNPSAPNLPTGSPSPVPSKPGTQACDNTSVKNEIDIVNNNVDSLKPKLDDIKDCSCPVKYSTSVVSGGSGNSGVISLPSRTIQVRLALTNIPYNPKTIQSGGANAPLQYFCGYYSFGDGVSLGARTAINVAQSVFEVPLWATSFSWSLYTGYEASVSLVTLVPEKAGAELASRQLKLAPT